MRKSQIIEFLEGAGDKPYRKLIEYHIKKSSTQKLMQAGLGESNLLPEELKPMAINYIDSVNAQLGYNGIFWAEATCQQAFERLIGIAFSVFKTELHMDSIEDALKPENQELSFCLFQIPTLSFAYSASTQRKQRKFMGIRKGIFG